MAAVCGPLAEPCRLGAVPHLAEGAVQAMRGLDGVVQARVPDAAGAAPLLPPAAVALPPGVQHCNANSSVLLDATLLYSCALLVVCPAA